MYKILIVEDDAILNNTLYYNLQLENYEVESATTVKDAIQKMNSSKIDLAVLDINLPDGNGYNLCKLFKEQHDVLVVFLTANDMESNALKGYELGADDYITKPFSMPVFLKKIAAILKRTDKKINTDIYNDGILSIDFDAANAKLNSENIIFTPLEFRMMKIFISNPSIVLTRNMLLEKLWDANGNFVDEHALTANISRLRGKIETNDKKYIKTVYGMGYMWLGD